MLPFNGNSNLVLTGNGTYSNIFEISGWRIDNGNLISLPTANIGVGTTNPQTKLHVNGDAIITGTVFTSHVMITDKVSSIKVQSDENMTKSANVEQYMAIGGGSNPPIPPTPGVSLEVYGNMLAAGTITGNTLKASNLQIIGPVELNDLHVLNQVEVGQSIWITGVNQAGTLKNEIYTDQAGDPTLYIQSKTNDFSTVINANNPGNVGIGTTSPQAKLDVNGIGRFGNSAGWVNVGYNSVNAFIDNEGAGSLLINYHTMKNTVIGKDVMNGGDLFVNNNVYLGLTSNSKVGIGTSSPQQNLHIKGETCTGENCQNSTVLSTVIRLDDHVYGDINRDVYWDLAASGATYGFHICTNSGGGLLKKAFTVKEGGSIIVYGSDLSLGVDDGRNQGQKLQSRALVHDGWENGLDNLVINYDGDFEDGVFVGGPKTVFDGIVGIGTSFTGNEKGYKLAVKGKIGAWAVEVETTSDAWADYVFNKDYPLLNLNEVETFINENKHLPGVPSGKEVEEKGHNLGEMDAVLLKKIEELTLYVIELKKENEELKSRMNKIENK